MALSILCTHLCVTFDLCGDEVVEDLGQLSEVDVDQLSLQVQAQQGEEIPLLNLNQLIIPLHSRINYATLQAVKNRETVLYTTHTYPKYSSVFFGWLLAERKKRQS